MNKSEQILFSFVVAFMIGFFIWVIATGARHQKNEDTRIQDQTLEEFNQEQYKDCIRYSRDKFINKCEILLK